MKTMKKLGAVILALCMCMALCVTAFAATGEGYEITIENATIGQTYTAYKIFDATYDEETGGVSYTIDSNSNLYSSIYQMTDIFNLTVKSTDSTSGVTTCYVTVKEGVTDAEVIAAIEGLDIESLVTASASTAEGGAASTTVTLDVGEPGYYYVTTSTGTAVTITTAAPAATVIDKNETVGGDKFYKYTTDAQGNVVKSVDIALGEELNFDITSNVPLYAGDEIVTEYQFTDTLGDTGLEIEIEVGTDFTNGDITRELGSDGQYHYYASDKLINQFVTLTNSTGTVKYTLSQVAYNYTLEFTDVTYDEESGYIVCGGFILTYYTYDVNSYVDGDPDTFDTSKYPTDLTIDIVYTTYVTDNANHTETNTATLRYWSTKYDNPTPEDPIPHNDQYSTDTMYDWDLQIVKIDGQDETHLLEGATFTLAGANLKDVQVTDSVTYTSISASEMEEGVTYYYLLANGRYTTVAPTDETVDQYDATTPGPYVRTYDSKVQVTDAGNTTVTGTTDEHGVVIFDGLSAGQYTLTEIVAPDGYNLLDDSITFTVTFNSSTGTFSVSDLTGASFNEDGELVITIENNTGSELPSTGGIGTTWFYIIGAALICGAAVVLITRRRMAR